MVQNSYTVQQLIDGKDQLVYGHHLLKSNGIPTMSDIKFFMSDVGISMSDINFPMSDIANCTSLTCGHHPTVQENND